jgi:hypothetical protein
MLAIKDIANRAGGVPELARKLGVSRQAIYQWSVVPLDKIDGVIRATGLSKSALRPDVFSDEMNASYEADLSTWAQRQADLLVHGQFSELDVHNLSEEIADMARRERDEIESRMSVLLVHLLKWRHQPELRSGSWAATILEQRTRINRRLQRSPSLQSVPSEVFAEEYTLARQMAALETGLPIGQFDEAPPFSVDQALDVEFLPDPAA